MRARMVGLRDCRPASSRTTAAVVLCDCRFPRSGVYFFRVHKQTADRRYTTGLLVLFAALGLLLAGIGVYGVVSYVVGQRTSEIGLRMALGAQRADVVWLVVRQGIRMATASAAAGLMGAWLLRKVVAQLVFGVSPADPITFLIAAAVLIVLAGVACLIPARRAIRIDPILALHYE